MKTLIHATRDAALGLVKMPVGARLFPRAFFDKNGRKFPAKKPPTNSFKMTPQQESFFPANFGEEFSQIRRKLRECQW